jgi:heme O synthase-like polyprenyltransferase
MFRTLATTALFQCVLGVYFYLLNSSTDVSDIGWLPVCSMIFYIVVYSFGKIKRTVPIVLGYLGVAGYLNIQ